MSTSHLYIEQLCDVTIHVAAQIEVLMSHLTAVQRPVVDVERLRMIVENPHSALFVAHCEGEIVGALTVAHYTTPVTDKLWIEDVVVAPSARGLGLGRKLVEAAIEWGRESFPTATIYLTSNPSRTAARALYASMGFEEYNTGVFRLMEITPKL
jgi:GNAT superfamily N-acetyltransferase